MAGKIHFFHVQRKLCMENIYSFRFIVSGKMYFFLKKKEPLQEEDTV
ncbi:hypothetical protein HMPREF3213_01451 [Heyndrickxia coagulans]|uniref:Uncharacterized protein n=1 Tax=Heyndrickxia coagulans TaxID=1398 RepID=A0A133KU12_HEYCO|nr:hypothetical protein HMPREF3213_01451 [Heyndrickxia coagulans]